jgi:cytochrome c
MRIAVPAVLLIATALAGCGDDRHDERLRAAGPHPDVEALLKVADVDAGARKFRTCAACHTVTQGSPDLGGPNLHGIYGQPPGRNSGRYGYTAALRSAGGRWDARRLDAWLTDPARVVPGTAMQFSGIPDPLDRADIIAYLRSQSD